MKNKIENLINNSFLVVKDAIGRNAKQIAYALRSVGKRCSASWVQKQGEFQAVKRANFYENFLRFLAAIYFANYAGFELLIIDLEMFVRELRRSSLKTQGTVFPDVESGILESLVKIKSEVGKLSEYFDLSANLKEGFI